MPYLHINSSSSVTWNSAPLLPEIYLHKVQYNWYTKCLLHILQVTNSFPQQLLFVKLHSSLNLHFFIQKQTQPSLCQKDDLKHSWRLSHNLPLSNSGSVKDVQGKNFCQQILAICSANLGNLFKLPIQKESFWFSHVPSLNFSWLHLYNMKNSLWPKLPPETFMKSGELDQHALSLVPLEPEASYYKVWIQKKTTKKSTLKTAELPFTTEYLF